jgi:DNA mismatch repair ATPase MutS
MQELSQNAWIKLKSWITDNKTKVQKELIDKFSADNNDEIIHHDIFKNLLIDINVIQNDTIIGTDVYRDIEFFDNINEGYFKTKTIYDVFNNHSLKGGEEISKKILAHPISNIKILNERQNIIREIESKYNESTEEILLSLKNLEKDVLWLYKDLDNNIQDLYNIVYFKINVLKQLNNNGHVLTGFNIYKILISPLIGILSPIIYFIIPFMVLIYKFKIHISFKTYLKLIYTTMMNQDMLLGNFGKLKAVRMISYMFSLIFYFQGVFNSVEISQSLYKMSNHLVGKINNVIKFLKLSQDFITQFWNDKLIGNYIIKNLSFIPNDETKKYIDTMKVIEFSLFNNFGEQLKNYKIINKEIITSILSKTYLLDSIISIVKFKQSKNLVYTEFIGNKKIPSIKIEGLWHPCLNQDIVVKNNIIFGCDNIPNNAIITGTNAAGKSLLIKSILVNILISQTCTLSISSKCQLTPLTYINSQISIPDCTGHESLFQAEMHRCKNNLITLEKLHSKQLSLIIVDEIFNSTNPIEAIAGGYAICKKLASYDNSIMIFTTHFNYLTKLGKITNKFKNYKMETIIDNNEITFTYKLKEGINKQYIALELLKKEGFDEDIINEAISIKNKFTLK